MDSIITVKTAQRAAQAARAAAKAAVVTVKAIAKATALAIKAIIAGTKALIAAIAAGGWVAVLVIIVICLIGMILGSVFGIFFSDEDSGKAVKKEPEKKTAPTVQAAPAPKEPEKPKDAPRRGKEQIVYIKLNELHAFKNHPFEVRDDEEMRAMVSSVKDKGVTQPAIVRPREDGGYEIVSGHRRQKASELAGYADMPCIVRNLTDDEAITQMVEDNLNQREEILPSERAKALKMQLEAIKHQGSRTSGQIDPKDAGKRSNEIVAERNKMAVKQVQRYIRLNELVPDLMKLMDEKKLGFTTAVELSYIGKKNQNYIAVAIDSQQSSPSQAQAKRMRELDEKKLLNGDVIDGIMMEDKKEVDKVILTGAELSKYFGKETTPREMKDQIIKLLAWDYAAGMLMIQEAGGKVTDFTGEPLEPKKGSSVVGTNGFIHTELLKLL